jgi:hypothetical protein
VTIRRRQRGHAVRHRRQGIGLDGRVVRRRRRQRDQRKQWRGVRGLVFVDAPHYSVDTSTPTAVVHYPFQFTSGTITTTPGGASTSTPLPPLAGNPGVTVSPDGIVPSLDLH